MSLYVVARCLICIGCVSCISVFFFNDTATTEIYTLSLHDALPISFGCDVEMVSAPYGETFSLDEIRRKLTPEIRARSEEHTSELQSHSDLVCRLLLEKKNTQSNQGRTAKLKQNSLPRLAVTSLYVD